MTSGTIIHTKSRMTDGATRARPAVVVCCVAILVAFSPHVPPAHRPSSWGRRRLSPQSVARALYPPRRHQRVFFVQSSTPPLSPFPQAERGRDGEERP